MKKLLPAHSETPELAAEASARADALGFSILSAVSSDPLDAAAQAALTADVVLCLLLGPPEPLRLIAAADTAGDRASRMILCLVSDADGTVRGLALDLGIPCVVELGAALACAALTPYAGLKPWHAQARKLSPTDRQRVEGALGASDKGAGKLHPLAVGCIGWEAPRGDVSVVLGHAADVSQALRALRLSQPLPPDQASPDGNSTFDAAPNSPDTARLVSREVLFGPRRLLSDPASKAALGPFGLPLPQEELCASPSRAAAEAARIGFPVRISLASPDLRVWDHADLSIDGVDNAARVRDVYRQLTLAAERRAPAARVLGVTVTATTLARALLRVHARPAGQRVLLKVTFADPHGAVARDAILTVLPANTEAIMRALERLDACSLILGDSTPDRMRQTATLADIFGRVAVFVSTFATEIERVDLHPLALLVGGGAEVREAAVQVTDLFSRGLG